MIVSYFLFSRPRQLCGFVDVLFGDEGCEIVGEWGVVVLILVEQEEDSHFNFLYKRAKLRGFWNIPAGPKSQRPVIRDLRIGLTGIWVFGAGLIVTGG